ncbi:MAG: hypothetical protein CEE42_03875 [Promethearchaeota archaeon Loki_b31]|nr:MAG: hypothetical protein CEE42_03875 [Candidatus Lokiarchaeota archaeon Loki_b31]
MRNYFDKNLIQQVFNSNEFKGWLLSRRWFGDKSSLSNLAFRVTISYFKIVSERIFLTIIVITTQEYTKSYFLPMISYGKIQEILEPREKTSGNIVQLTENTYSKMVALNVYDKQKEKIISLNLVEAEYCVFFWKKMLFDKKITEAFPALSMELTLYSEQFEDEINMTKVRNLIEASLYPERYEYGLEQLGGGNTTNLLFLLKIYKKSTNKEPISYILKSYKDYSGSLEPRTLFVLVKNNFPNAPKIYGTIKLQGKETIGILEDVSNIGNLGDIYWNEVNKMIYDVFKRVNDDYSYLNNKENMSNMIKKHCVESLKVSEKIGFQIKKLHNALILKDDPLYSKEMVDSKDYLKNYTDNLNSMVSKILNYTSKKSEGAFYNSPKITSIFLDIKDIIEKFRSEFDIQQITIQPVHQDLHFQQILYNKNNGDYVFYFIDFEGDPQLSQEERKERFPIEKDLASFLRSLSYIKFNTLINFIEKNIVDKNKFEVPAEFLFSLYFRKSSKISKKHKTLEIALNLLNLWENKLMGKIFDKSLKLHFTLINYFTIERTLHELNYELLFRPNNIIIPILGLKEIIDKN